MNTKEAIKAAACTLFNSRGLSEVTLRDVAQALHRSYGNITYHFASKEPLVEALYLDMVAALSAVSGAFTQTEDPLTSILKAPQQTFAISLQYLFLFRDYLEVMRNYPLVAERVRLSNAARKPRFLAIFVHLRDTELLRPELTDDDLDYLMELSGAMRTFFFLQMRPEDLQKPSLETEYVTYVNRLLFPYLSEKGQAVYHLLMR